VRVMPSHKKNWITKDCYASSKPSRALEASAEMSVKRSWMQQGVILQQLHPQDLPLPAREN